MIRFGLLSPPPVLPCQRRPRTQAIHVMQQIRVIGLRLSRTKQVRVIGRAIRVIGKCDSTLHTFAALRQVSVQFESTVLVGSAAARARCDMQARQRMWVKRTSTGAPWNSCRPAKKHRVSTKHLVSALDNQVPDISNLPCSP